MPTQLATGTSTLKATAQAAAQATEQALAGLGGRTPSFGFVFVGAQHALGDALTAARAAGGGDLLGCTTAGEITERGLTKGGVTVCLVASEELIHEVAFAPDLKDREAAVARLTEGFAGLSGRARERRFVESMTVLLVDGLCGAGEQLVPGIMKATRPSHQVVGGAAGDDGRFEATWVGAGAGARKEAAAALHAFAARPFGVGVDHGLRPSTAKMQVTRAKGNVVYELDGRPAFEVYREYARERGVDLQRETAGPFLVNNELGVYFLSHLQRARAPLSVGTDGSLTCAATIEEGASVTILDGKRDQLVAAARNAAEEAKKNLQGHPASGVLLFDCICRGSILGEDFGREIDAVRAIFPDVPVAGFLTYGEIARYKGKLEGWHNTTAVVVALPA